MIAMQQWLKEQIALCRQKKAQLDADDRSDEAVFEQIRGNVYGIFDSVLEVALKMPEGRAFFAQRLDQIPSAWRDALAKAIPHGDQQRIYIETIKLETAARIKNAFEGIWREEA